MRRKKKAATELKDLEIDRVDGVDKPATGRTFILMKRAEVERMNRAHIRKWEHERVEFASPLPRPESVSKRFSPALGRGLFANVIRQF